MKIKLGRPSVVVQCPRVFPENAIPWGEYQFPGIYHTSDGGFDVRYHMNEDSARAYGEPWAHAVSRDGGKTWKMCAEDDGYTAGIFLPDGSAVRCYNARPSIHLDDLPDGFVLPDTPDGQIIHWHEPSQMYYASRFGDYSWMLEKKSPDGAWHEVCFDLKLPENHARYTSVGVIPRNNLHRLRVAPDGKLWAMAYPFFLNGYCGKTVNQPVFLVSGDGGETFEFRGTIPYEPIPEADKFYAERDGFTEPDLAFLPNGTLVCIMRTQDCRGNGPSYIAYSKDDGRTWSKPEIFDELGVLPSVVTLACGVTLALYGRPGIYLRATDDPEARVWEDRVTVLEPDVKSCCNASLLVTGENTAAVVYSHFTYPDRDGVPRKTILFRTVEVELT
jgi:hypothetical protein